MGGDSIIYSVLLSCGGVAEDLRKPFVILDGIDLTWGQNQFTFFELMTNAERGLSYNTNELFGGQPIIDILQNAGYDIIFIDYIRIQDNAARAANSVFQHKAARIP